MAVGSFLRDVAKPMEDALQNNGVTQAFLGLEMSWTDQSDSEAVVRHSLESPAATRTIAQKEEAKLAEVTLDVTGLLKIFNLHPNDWS